jgi:uncharacterized protein (TIGR03435 family)
VLRKWTCGLTILLASATVLAQAPRRSFEVASIRPRLAPSGTIDISTSGLRLNAESAALRYLIQYAWNVRMFQVAESPALLAFGDTFYDIAGRAEGEAPPTATEFREMLQTLLADRFHLRLHREQRPTQVWALLTARSGPKLKPSAGGGGPSGMGISGRNNVLNLREATMEDLAAELDNTAFLDRPVVDQTGLNGAYDIKLTYTPENRIGRGEPDPAEIRIFTALSEQLGLRLVQQKADVEFLVVDHVEKPAGN